MLGITKAVRNHGRGSRKGRLEGTRRWHNRKMGGRGAYTQRRQTQELENYWSGLQEA